MPIKKMLVLLIFIFILSLAYSSFLLAIKHKEIKLIIRAPQQKIQTAEVEFKEGKKIFKKDLFLEPKKYKLKVWADYNLVGMKEIDLTKNLPQLPTQDLSLQGIIQNDIKMARLNASKTIEYVLPLTIREDIKEIKIYWEFIHQKDVTGQLVKLDLLKQNQTILCTSNCGLTN